jgi:hypothetical protein
MSIGWEEWGGPHLAEAKPTGKTPESLKCIGGIWDPLSCEYIEKVTKPIVKLKLQAQQTASVASEASFLCVLGGERSGKTQVGRFIAERLMIEKPGYRVFYALPKFSKQDVVVPEIEEDLKRWIAYKDKVLHKWELMNGSVLRLFSMANKQHEETFLGDECDLFILEEFREMPSRVFKKAFSRVISRNGRMVIVSSPEVGHMLEDIARGQFDEVNFEVHNLSVEKNFFVLTNKENPRHMLEKAKKLYDPARYKRMVLGQFVPEAGHDYYNFERDIHVIDGYKGIPCTEMLWSSDDLWLSKDPRWTGNGSVVANPEFAGIDKVVGLDFGAVVMTAVEGIITVEGLTSIAGPAALTYESTNLVITRVLKKHDTGTVDFIQTVMIPSGLDPRRTMIFCDPSGLARDHVHGESPVDVLKFYGYKVFCTKTGDRRKPGIEAVRTRLHMRRLFINRNKSTESLVTDLIKVKSSGKTQREISADPYGHAPDALRYIVVNLWPERDLFKKDNLDVVLKSYEK